MSSYRYYVEITIPGSESTPMGMPRVLHREYGGATGAVSATGYARAQHRLDEGTRIRIARRRLVLERVDHGDSAVAALAREERRMVPAGPELLYRRYVVQSGIVRRTDR